MIRSDRSLEPDFILSFAPIALVYAVAHDFSFFVIQGRSLWPLASDPFGFGWDLFGGVDYAANIAPQRRRRRGLAVSLRERRVGRSREEDRDES